MYTEDRVIIIDQKLDKVLNELNTIKNNLANFKRDSNELQAVMISVDKWLDDPSDLEENPATRAARAREIALKAIEAAEARIAEMLRVAMDWTRYEDAVAGSSSSADVVNRMLAAMRRIAKLGKGGA